MQWHDGSVRLIIIAVLVMMLIAGCGQHSHPDRVARVVRSQTTSPDLLPNEPPTNRNALVSDLDRAQQIIDSTSSTSGELASAGRFEQVATRALDAEPIRARRATLALLGAQAAATMRVSLAAADALSTLLAPPHGLPHWKIVQPPAPSTLLGYFRTAESRFGVPWQDLAAIEFIETRFGRVRGLSTAGAQGPMQFLPTTWARYGSGHIDNPRDAILSAARYLVANGAPGDIATALYHYNNSRDYVHAVLDYAGRMRAHTRAYYGYYYWQVMYTYTGGTVILPPGYPTARPVAVR
jgi:Transglycosylase SLT domain